MGIDLSMGGSLTGAAGLGGLWEEEESDAHVGTQEVLVQEEGFEHWKGRGDSEKRVRCIKLQGQGGAALSKGLRFSSVGQQSLNHEPRMMWSDLGWGREYWVPLGNSLLTPMSCL